MKYSIFMTVNCFQQFKMIQTYYLLFSILKDYNPASQIHISSILVIINQFLLSLIFSFCPKNLTYFHHQKYQNLLTYFYFFDHFINLLQLAINLYLTIHLFHFYFLISCLTQRHVLFLYFHHLILMLCDFLKYSMNFNFISQVIDSIIFFCFRHQTHFMLIYNYFQIITLTA